MLVKTPTQSTTLYYRDRTSDKVYQASLEPVGDGFVVQFAYGRRGSSLNTGTKTQCPVDYEEAQRIYDKLIREKKAKGYTEGPNGTPYQHTDKADRVTGILPQLLNPVEEQEVHCLADDPSWCFQPKFDGRRLLIQKTGSEVIGINRKGLIVSLPECLVHAALHLPGDFILDGEAVGLVYHSFDLLESNQEDCRGLPLRVRMERLLQELSPRAHPYILAAQTAWTTADKQALLHSLRQQNQEGVVMKEIHAAYQPGRPHSGGPALKHKFYATLSAVVTALNQKRSVQISLLGKEGWISVGNVTVPASHPLPRAGDVIELRYLYAYLGGAVYQPVYLGKRGDVDASECRASQLKFKPDGGESDG